MVDILSNRHPPNILPNVQPSAVHLGIFVIHFTNMQEKHRANIASEYLTSTLVAGTTDATFFSSKMCRN